jgi:folate/biopterin transporter
MFKSYSVPAPQVQVYTGVTMLPWAMKPVIGLISDYFPLFGYNKAPYMVLTTLAGITAYASLGLIPETLMPVGVAVIFVFMATSQTSTADLLAEAKYSEKIKANPEHGPSLLSYVWLGMQVGGLVAIAASGVVLTYYGWHAVFAMTVVPAAVLLFPVLAGYLGEEPVSDEAVADVRNRFCEQREMCFLCLVMLIATTSLTASGMYIENHAVNAALALVIGAVVLLSFSVSLSPTVAKFNAFALIQTACKLSTSGAAFYFYTDTPEQYPATDTSPGGPHFSKFFYVSVLGTISGICSLIGIWTYMRWMSTWRYRSLLVFTNLTVSLFFFLDVLFFSRVTKRMGIPDEYFVIGTDIFEEILGTWQWMPQVTILSYMVPRGMEATMFALLAGCHNFGTVISNNCGALLLQQLGVRPQGAVGETAMFDNLWIASAIGTTLPLVAICALFWLIPDCSQTEKFTHEETDSVTTGSLWRRWRGFEQS